VITLKSAGELKSAKPELFLETRKNKKSKLIIPNVLVVGDV